MIRNANIYDPFGPSKFFMPKEISVQGILFGPFRNLYEGNMNILIIPGDFTHVTRSRSLKS